MSALKHFQKARHLNEHHIHPNVDTLLGRQGYIYTEQKQNFPRRIATFGDTEKQTIYISATLHAGILMLTYVSVEAELLFLLLAWYSD